MDLAEKKATEVETIGIYEISFTITGMKDWIKEVRKVTEIFQMSDTMHGHYAVPNDIMKSIAMMQDINFKIWQCF